MQPASDIQAIHSTRRGLLGRLRFVAVRDSGRPPGLWGRLLFEIRGRHLTRIVAIREADRHRVVLNPSNDRPRRQRSPVGLLFLLIHNASRLRPSRLKTGFHLHSCRQRWQGCSGNRVRRPTSGQGATGRDSRERPATFAHNQRRRGSAGMNKGLAAVVYGCHQATPAVSSVCREGYPGPLVFLCFGSPAQERVDGD